MVNHQSFARFDEIDEGLLGVLAPTQRGLARVIVVDDDKVIGREAFGAGAAPADWDQAGSGRAASPHRAIRSRRSVLARADMA